MRKLTRLELKIMRALWNGGQLSIREIQEAFLESELPSYTTVQTTVYRLENKQAVRRVRKIGNAHIFEAVLSRKAAERTVVDDLLGLLGGSIQPVMAHLVNSGKLTLEDVREAERALRKLSKEEKSR